MDEETRVSELKKKLKEFRDEREWGKFHNPKNIAESISVEAGELLELFLWKNPEEISQALSDDPAYLQEIKDEMSDVLSGILHLANSLNVDVATALFEKNDKAEKKYPVEKSKGNATKYTKL